MSPDQITTITFFRYKTFSRKLWAFGMMQFAHKHLVRVRGQRFYKLMGSGKGLGFNPLPDWSVYCLLQVWDGHHAAAQFFTSSGLVEEYRSHSVEIYTIYMHMLQSQGFWSGIEPFGKAGRAAPEKKPIAVITRATIKASRLYAFWRYVPASQKPLKHAEGLIYTKGIGEVPIKQMATFSLWKDLESLRKFAYHSQEHQKAIQMTRQLGWYSEELFARFQPYAVAGSWEGRNLLPGVEVIG